VRLEDMTWDVVHTGVPRLTVTYMQRRAALDWMEQRGSLLAEDVLILGGEWADLAQVTLEASRRWGRSSQQTLRGAVRDREAVADYLRAKARMERGQLGRVPDA
jgi:hypothetical protein